uniref:Vacuolar protein sorting-associated protein 41 homolog n=2 Tax=Hirondellea gigas TaxID=1518452 RepID=A0A6A7FZH2_9CRUS
MSGKVLETKPNVGSVNTHTIDKSAVDSKDGNTAELEESSSGTSSEYESESDSEEEEEPRLKYERVRGNLATLLDRDSLTSIASNDKLVVLGTMGGGVVILDHLGYNIQHRRPHVAPVLSVALAGDYWASAGKDRKVVVNGMLSQECNHSVTLETGAVVCVLLDPQFAQHRSTTRFAVGHTNGLSLYERSLFGGYKCCALSDSVGGSIGASIGLTGGAVRGAAWKGSLLAWATDTGVRVYHLTFKTTIALIQRDHSAALDSIQFPPHLRWNTEETLLIGWGDSIKVCRIKPRPKESVINSRATSRGNSNRNSPTDSTATESMRSTSFTPHGASAFDKRNSRRGSVTSLIVTQVPSASPAATTKSISVADNTDSSTKKHLAGSTSRSGHTSTAGSATTATGVNINSSAMFSSSVALSHGSSSIMSSSIIGITGGYGRATPNTPPLDLPPLYVEIECMFSVPFYICGLGMMDDLIIALTYNKTPTLECSRSSPTDTKGPQQFTDDPFEWRRPQLRLLLPQQRTYEEMSKDILGTKRYKDYLPLHYKLECVMGDDRWYVLSPRDLVVAKPREPIDSLEWMLQYHKYPLAIQLLEKEGGTIGEHTEDSVGHKYLNYLLECHMYSQAAKISPRVLGENVSGWKHLVQVFSAAGELSILHEYLPYSSPPYLPVEIYAQVLLDLLENDHHGLVTALQKWPSTCYNVNEIVSSVLAKVATQSWSGPLLQSLAHLYSHQQRHDKALAIYIKLQHKDIFGLIKKHNLYFTISTYAVNLMALDSDVTTELCMTHIKEVPPSEMMPALAGHTNYLYKYLSALYEQHTELCNNYHDLLVQLMADNQQANKLLKFLKTSTNYDLTKALQVCKRQGLLHHTVYLLDRTGNIQDALSLVLLEARDLTWAIQLCKDHNDPHLWDVLIDNTVHYAENIRPLLEEGGKYVGDVQILRRIPPGLEIPDLMKSISTIMENIKKKYALHNGSERLCKRDIVRLTCKRKCQATRAVIVDEDKLCPNCGRSVLGKEGKRAGGLISFKCDHVFHVNCLAEASEVAKQRALSAVISTNGLKNVNKLKKRVVPPPAFLCVVCQLKNNLFGVKHVLRLE